MRDTHDPRMLLIGAGNMGGAMVRRWLSSGINLGGLSVVDPHPREPIDGIDIVAELPAGETAACLVILAVKPQQLQHIAGAIAPHVGQETLVLSILAGTRLATLRALLPTAGKVVRLMPNLPVAIGKGVLAVSSEHLEDAETRLLATFLDPLGTILWNVEEQNFDIITALSGSGPAFVFRFVDALATAAERLGLPADQAAMIALATVNGAGALAAKSAISLAALADQVASPGGTTREGLDVLDSDGALQQLIDHTLRAATQRARVLADANG